MKLRYLLPAFFALLLLAASSSGAFAQANIWLDFDDDNDPWTLRTSLPDGELTGRVRFVLEVVMLPYPALYFMGEVAEGCCEFPQSDAHYGTFVVPESVVFDSTFVTNVTTGFPTCTYCCPWVLWGTLDPNAPVEDGHRYFVGEAVWNAYCDVQAGCVPPTSFDMTFQNIGGGGHMTFVCPPTPVEEKSWGKLKSIYR